MTDTVLNTTDHTAGLNLEVTIAARVEIWKCAIIVVKHTCTLIELNFTSELNTTRAFACPSRLLSPQTVRKKMVSTVCVSEALAFLLFYGTFLLWWWLVHRLQLVPSAQGRHAVLREAWLIRAL